MTKEIGGDHIALGLDMRTSLGVSQICMREQYWGVIDGIVEKEAETKAKIQRGFGTYFQNFLTFE